jgi:hypothetical protein
MKHTWLVVMVAVGCSKTKSSDEPAPRTVEPAGAPGSATAVTSAADPACIESTQKLGTWIKTLHAEGMSPILSGTNLVKLDEMAKAMPTAPVVTINAEQVTMSGQLVGDPKDGKPAAFDDLADRLRALPKESDAVYYVVDDKTP